MPETFAPCTHQRKASHPKTEKPRKAQLIFSKVFGILNPFFPKGVKQGLGQRPNIIN